VSVILSGYNGAADLTKAIDAIPTQPFVDFKLIAIDNGSNDGTAAEPDAIPASGSRKEDIGFAAALNRGIALAGGRYIARRDHDDWAKPTRLEKQVAFLEAHLDHALVGTRGGRERRAAVRARVRNALVHSSLLLRKSALDLVDHYTTDPAQQPPWLSRAAEAARYAARPHGPGKHRFWVRLRSGSAP
jgi:glycosyltransferase involved in cell wall biosynthesis